jgi:hypothetical protein
MEEINSDPKATRHIRNYLGFFESKMKRFKNFEAKYTVPPLCIKNDSKYSDYYPANFCLENYHNHSLFIQYEDMGDGRYKQMDFFYYTTFKCRQVVLKLFNYSRNHPQFQKLGNLRVKSVTAHEGDEWQDELDWYSSLSKNEAGKWCLCTISEDEIDLFGLEFNPEEAMTVELELYSRKAVLKQRWVLIIDEIWRHRNRVLNRKKSSNN